MSLPRLSKPVRLAWLLSAGAVLAAAGCEERPSTPKDSFERLRECRKARTYATMRPYLHASGREGMIDLLVAVDELLLANTAAHAAARQACPGAEIPYDFTLIQDRLEIFSRDVELIDIKEKGDRAVVTLQIAGRLPVVSTQFVRTNGVWQYVPAPDQLGVVKAIRQLTRALQQVELSLSGHPVTPQQINEEYRIRVGPRLKAFEQLEGHSATREVASVVPS